MTFPLLELGGAGPVVHVAPATGFPPATYEPVIEGVRARHRVVCIPPRALWPGIGAPPEASGSWESIADDLMAGWQEHGLAPVIAVGHSAGGVASLLASIRARPLVRALVLFDPTIRTPKIMEQVAASKQAHGEVRFHLVDTAMRRRSVFDSPESAFAYWRKRKLFADWSDEALGRYTRSMLRPAADGRGYTLAWSPAWEAWYYRSIYTNTWHDIPNLDRGLPLLVVYGEVSDTFTTESAALFRQAAPQATLVAVPGAGHLFPQSHPRETRDILDRWLAALP